METGRQAGRQANLKEISSRKLPSYAKHTKHQKPALATTNRSKETGARDTKPSDNECTNRKPNEKKRLNPSGERECGIIKSGWRRTGRRPCWEQGALEDEQASKECVVLFQSGTQRQGIKNRAKDEKDSVNKRCVTLWPCHLH